MNNKTVKNKKPKKKIFFPF